MPKNSLADYDSSAGNNTDIGGIDIDENCAPGGLNDAIRELMSHIADWLAAPVNTSKPAFLRYNNVTDSNVTGNGTVHTVIFDTEVYDQDNNHDGTTFTAPVTGKYLMTCKIRLNGLTSAADQVNMTITTSNRTYTARWTKTNDLLSDFMAQMTEIVDMDASDTATITIQVTGEASDVVDIPSGYYTTWSGCLLA